MVKSSYSLQQGILLVREAFLNVVNLLFEINVAFFQTLIHLEHQELRQQLLFLVLRRREDLLHVSYLRHSLFNLPIYICFHPFCSIMEVGNDTSGRH